MFESVDGALADALRIGVVGEAGAEQALGVVLPAQGAAVGLGVGQRAPQCVAARYSQRFALHFVPEIILFI